MKWLSNIFSYARTHYVKASVAIIVSVAILWLAFCWLSCCSHCKRKVHEINTENYNTNMESCQKSALTLHPGKIVGIELEKEDGKQIFDIDIYGNDGKNWEIECDIATASVVEDHLDH